MEVLPLLAALLLAGVHLATPALRFLGGIPRSIWLSVAGGVSVAYVFVHLLPELAESQRRVGDAVAGPAAFAERHVYLIALAGLAAFYGLERLAKASRGGEEARARGPDAAAATTVGVFWIHMASFTVYNVLIGYLLVSEGRTERGLAFFAAAMALHFVVTDSGLAEDHKHRFLVVGRWVLAAAVLGGWAAGRVLEVDAAAIAVPVAFVAGGVILNVLKEEIPNERRSRFWAFALGIAAYTALLLAV